MLAIPVHRRTPLMRAGNVRLPRNPLTLKSFSRSPLRAARVAPRLPSFGVEGRDVAQRSIEILIGRLVTDEAFRSEFLRDPGATLIRFTESGYDLSELEIAAVRATPVDAWERVAEQIDPRLQKASFSRGAAHEGERL